MKQQPICPEIEEIPMEKKLASMKARLEVRRDKLNKRIDKVIRTEVTEKNSGGEDLRVWLDQFVKGTGVDICCGNFLIGETGVDSSAYVVGNDYNFSGEDLSTFEPDTMDYIVCNYFDCFDSPLKALNEWWRTLKPGGTLAFICTNAECHPLEGTLLNGKRRFLYTPHTITQFMNKVKFKNIEVKPHKTAIFVKGIK